MPCPWSKSLGIFFFGHLVMQMPQPVHLSSSTERALRRTVTEKLPMYPSTFSTSAKV